MKKIDKRKTKKQVKDKESIFSDLMSEDFFPTQSLEEKCRKYV